MSSESFDSVVDTGNLNSSTTNRATGAATFDSRLSDASPIAPSESIPLHLRELVRLANLADELRGEVTLFRQLDRALPELVIMTDANGSPIYQNSAWRRYVGSSTDLMTRVRWEVLCAADDIFKVKAVWARALKSGDPFAIEARLRRHDNVCRWFSCQAVQVKNDKGVATNWLVVCTDTQAAHDAREAQERQVMESRRKDEFLATLAHELRSPLAPIKNALDVLKQNDIDVRMRENALGIMERQVDFLVRLVEELMDVSRYNLGTVEMRRERIALGDVLERVLEATQSAIEHAQHQLHVDLPTRPVLLHADPLRLTQVLVNLINNAIKYTARGGVLHVSAGEVGDGAELRISDNGIGIAHHDLERIFDLFNRGNRPANHTAEGVGIGLTLVRRFVAAHGGHVYALSDGPGTGSTFVVQLPRPV